MGKYIFIAIAICFLASCGPLKSPAGKAETITLKFVQINDVYEISPLGEFGGMARVGHIRDSIKNIYPNTYLFLAGDFLNPSLLGTLKMNGERIYGKQMVEVLNELEVDLVTFGNHEFDLTEDDLQKRLDESNFKWTSANVRHNTKNGPIPFFANRNGATVPVSEYAIFSVDSKQGSMRFGVIGVTIPSNPKDYVAYQDIYETAERSYNSAKQKTDFIIGLTHVSLGSDKEIANRIPSLPLIMGGHEHNNMLERQGNTIIAKADANAKSLYVHTLLYNVNTKNLHIDSELMMVTDKIASSAKVAKVVDKWTGIMESRLKEVIDDPYENIHYTSIPWDGTDAASRSKQTNLGEIITKSMANVYGPNVQAAVVNGGSIRIDDNLSGTISSMDIFRILPFGGSVLHVDLKGKLLKETLDFGNEKIGTGAYLHRYNLSKNTTGQWQIGAEEIDDEKIYSVAFSDFLLKGLDIPFLKPDNPDVLKIYYPNNSEDANDIRKAIISYLKSEEGLD